MKNLLKFTVLFSFLAFVSCNNDEEISPADINFMYTKKIITYVPQFENFETKSVKNFDANGLSINQFKYNNQNQLISSSEYFRTPTQNTTINYDAQNVITSKYFENFDAQGRLIENYSLNASTNEVSFRIIYAYPDATTILSSRVENTVTTPYMKYKINSMGYIYSQEELTGQLNKRILTFDNEKPISMLVYDGTEVISTWNFQYYAQQKPLNIQKTNIQINNATLSGVLIEHLVYNCNFYFKEINDFYNNDYLFNSSNYLEHTLSTYGLNNLSESFYYYE